MKDTLISLGLISLMVALFIVTILSTGHASFGLSECIPIAAAVLMIVAIISSHKASKRKHME
ncbi:MAG: hypothetical protein QM645_01110 [Asticcacaulis sp.]